LYLITLSAFPRQFNYLRSYRHYRLMSGWMDEGTP